MSIVIDASVFVASIRAIETKHPVSRRFLLHAASTGERAYAPALLIPECACAVARYLGRTDEAYQAVRTLKSMTWLRIEPVSLDLADSAAQLGAQCRVRGSDACYLALSIQLAGTLITWDREMLERGAALVTTMTPEQWLKQHADARES